MSKPRQYRKKPVVIEAIQYTGSNINEVADFVEGEVRDWGYSENSDYYEIETLEGTMRADHGDFIIKGVSNEFYPCKPDIFAKTYEAVE
jgi:hypothetical protein